MKKKLCALIFLIIATSCLSASNIHAFDFDVNKEQVDKKLNEPKDSRTSADNLKLGWLFYIFKNDTTKAITHLERSIELDARTYEAHLLLGIINRELGNTEKAFDFWFSCLDFDRLESNYIISEIMQLELSYGNVQKLIKKLEGIIESPGHILLKPKARWYLAYLYRKISNLTKSRQAYKKIGFIDKWMIIGPFDNKEKMALKEPYLPESEIDFDKSYTGKVKKICWRELNYLEYDQTVNLNSVLYPQSWAAAYGLTYIYSPADKDVIFWVGSDDAIKVWLNDFLIFKNENYQSFITDQYAIHVKLNKGWNKVLVKVCEGIGSWGFGLRVTDSGARPLTGLKYSREIKPYSKIDPLSGLKTTPVVSVKEHLRQKLKENPNNLFIRYILAESLRLLDLKKDSIKEYEELVKLCPNSACFLFGQGRILANDGNVEKAFKCYKKAASLNKKHLQCLLKIAYYFYNDERYDKALYYTSKIKKVNANYLNNRFLIAKIYRYKDWYFDAYKEMKDVVELAPTVKVYLNWMAYMAYFLDKHKDEVEFYKRALKYDRCGSYAKKELIDKYKLLGKKQEVISLYHELFKQYPIYINYYTQLAEYYCSFDEFEKGIEVCEQGLLISPDNFNLLKQKGSLYYCAGNTEEAIKLWQKALLIKPAYQELREHIEFVQKQKETVFTKYAMSDNDVNDLIQRPITDSEYPEAPAVELLDERIIQIFNDGSTYNFVHKAIKILDKSGIDEYSRIRLPACWDLKIKKSVVITPKGEELEITEIKYDTLYPPNLEVGSVIEYKCEFTSNNNLIDGHFYDTEYFQDVVPIARKSFVVSCPSDKKLSIYTENKNIGFARQRYKDNHVYIWQASDIPKIELEDNTPGIGDIIDAVIISTIPSWDYLAKWENSLIDDQLEVDSQIREKIHELINGKETDEEKVKALYYFITKEIRYVSISHAVFGWKANRASKIYADKYGDCKDKAVLMMAMLKEIGIESHYALLSTRNYKLLKKDIPAPYMNHAIVYIPELDGKKVGKFIDMTANNFSYNSLPTMDEGVYAVVFKSPGYEFIKIPSSKAQSNLSSSNMAIEFTDDGIKGKDSAILTGIYSAIARHMMEDKRTAEKIIEEAIGEDVPGVELTKYEITNEDDIDKPFIINTEFKAPSLLGRLNDSEYSLSVIGKFRLVDKLAPSAKRHYDLDLEFARAGHSEETIILPSGYKIVSVPKVFEIATDFVTYQIEYKNENNILKITRAFSLLQANIMKNKYPEFRKTLIKIDKIENRKIIISNE